jgi:hypothetical protein
MNKPEILLQRLNKIGESLSKRGTALALIGLGSVGIALDRLDQFSDLDFFVIVTAGVKSEYLEDLSWLTEIAPADYFFKNTPDGYKFLYADGVFCEFAVFEEDELANVAFSQGRIVWKAAGVNDDIHMPKHPVDKIKSPSTEWLIGEALTNLYVGLSREQRGEKLSACRFIQGYAVDRILQLTNQIMDPSSDNSDHFDRERRFEQRFPEMRNILPKLMPGYDRNRESALAILSFLDKHFEINVALKREIHKLCRVDQYSLDQT